MITLADVHGLWRRDLLTAPGVEDRTTKVFWAQGFKEFADLRVPAKLPGFRGITALRDLSRPQASALTGCDGFAGRTDVTDNLCCWTRLLNYRGPVQAPDIGRLTWEVPGEVLIEDGTEAPYSETWIRTDPGPFRTAMFAGQGGQTARLVWSDRTFLLARAHPSALSGTALVDAVEAREFCALDQEFALGRWKRGLGIVDLSTQPWRRGTPIVQLDRGGLLRLSCCRAEGTDWEIWHRI